MLAVRTALAGQKCGPNGQARCELGGAEGAPSPEGSSALAKPRVWNDGIDESVCRVAIGDACGIIHSGDGN